VLFWMPDFFNRVFGMSQARLGLPVAVIFSLAAAGALTSGALFPRLRRAGYDMNAARKRSMLFFALVVLAMPLALLTRNVWVAAGLIGLGLFAHQGFSTNIFGMASDIVPAQRIACGHGGDRTGRVVLVQRVWLYADVRPLRRGLFAGLGLDPSGDAQAGSGLRA